MTRHLFFAIVVIGTGAFLNSPAEAATALQCEDRAANCLGRCRDMSGGAGDWKGLQNKCVPSCVRRLLRCYPRHATRIP
jgi:hypothetical protein